MSILDSAELLLQAKNYSGSGNWLDETANSHDAVNNGALHKAHTTDSYFFFPGITSNRLTVPTNANLDLTVDGEWRWDYASDDWTPSAEVEIGRRAEGGGESQWFVRLKTDGKLNLTVYAVNGSTSSSFTSTAALSLSDGVRRQLRITIDGNNGASGSDVTFYHRAANQALTDNVAAWTQLGDVVTNGVVQAYKAVAASWKFGETSVMPIGDLYRFILYNAIAGTILLDVAAADATEPYATFTEASSNAHTVTIARSGTALITTVVDRDMWLLNTNDYFEVADSASLDFGNTDSFTVMATFRTRTVASGSDVLVAKKDNLTTSLGYALVRNTTNSQGIVADGTLDDTDEKVTIAVHTIHTAAFVRNTTDDDIEAFLDGVGSGSATTDSTTTTLANAFPLRIGATSDTAASFLEGEICAVAVWASALTDIQIADAHTLLTTDVSLGHPHNRNVTAGQLLLTG